MQQLMGYIGYQPIPVEQGEPPHQPWWRRLAIFLLWVLPMIDIAANVSSFVVGMFAAREQYVQDNAPNPCDVHLTNLANNMMEPFHHELPPIHVNRTVLFTELSEMVERSRHPHSQVRMIVVLGRRQVGKTSIVRERFMNEKNVYYHDCSARNMHLGEDRDRACGNQYLSKVHVQSIIHDVYKKTSQNITLIFDIPHNAENSDVTRVYEDMKSMVYDDAAVRAPVLGVIILSNHYQIDAFPRDSGRFETLWVGNLEQPEAFEYLDKMGADKKVIDETGPGLRELSWATRLPQWKRQVDRSVSSAWSNKNGRRLMQRISPGGLGGVTLMDLVLMENRDGFSTDDLFHIVRPFSEVFYFDVDRQAFFFVSPYHNTTFLNMNVKQRTEL
uniref:ATPase-like protein n=1 Tax=Pfiesteria piscicida TaxID=71001 RepID=A3E3J3_PFIPI|nr:ATPase-like protein [Pfiesteria piscicida]